MSSNIPRVAIVDAYSSAHLLPHWFRANGHDCVHISSSDFVERRYKQSFRSSDFCETLQYRGDLDPVLEQLKRIGVAAVVAGAETGVLLADALASRLDVPSNGTRRSAARRDKYLLSEVLRESNLSAVRGLRVGSVEAGVSWARQLDQWPVVAKPCASAGGDSVVLCSNEKELEQSLEGIIDRVNKIGLVNEGALVQEHVTGDVYSVNTVSCEGRHYVTNIWKYEKQGFLYDHEYLIPSEGEIQSILIAYVSAVLDAMEITYGPAHIELIYRGETPVVVDFGARLHGCDSPVINRECTGIGQDELTAAAYVNKDEFWRKTRKPYHIYKHLMTVDFISGTEGRITTLDTFEKLKNLDSYHFLRLDLKAGGNLSRTVDLFTSPGLVELVHRDFQQLKRDLSTIRELEASGLYQTDRNTD